jgi:UDP-2-acetamido-3-amino-2,3-dideoxy-glucuronate N-acetyltransferase
MREANITDQLKMVECEGGYYYLHPDAKVGKAAIVGAETKIWAGAHIFDGAKIGANCVLAAGVHVETEAELGDFGKVQRGVVLYRGVKASDYVFFGPNSTTTNDRNPRAFGEWELTETKIETGASIGANATIIAGNTIGPLALVGAGAVVSKSVRGCELVLGNPARFAGWVDVNGSVISRDGRAPLVVEEILKDPLAAITGKELRQGDRH